jgi:hypothetical protein
MMKVPDPPARSVTVQPVKSALSNPPLVINSIPRAVHGADATATNATTTVMALRILMIASPFVERSATGPAPAVALQRAVAVARPLVCGPPALPICPLARSGACLRSGDDAYVTISGYQSQLV